MIGLRLRRRLQLMGMGVTIIAPITAVVMLSASTSVHAANLLEDLVDKPFVAPDAMARPAPLTIVRRAPGVIEVQIAGEIIDRYELSTDEIGRHLHPATPEDVGLARFSANAWSIERRGLVTTFSLSPAGDIEVRRSGALEGWESDRFTYAFSPSRPGLGAALQGEVRRIKEEAERFEGHDHGAH